MKPTLQRVLLPASLLLLIFAAAAPCPDSESAAADRMVLYVSPQGSDHWSGTLPGPTAGGDGPFATLARARDAVRERRRKGDGRQFVIELRGGTYRLSETFTLGAEDSGSPSHPLVIRPFADERPVLTGARQITPFRRHRGSIFRSELKGSPLEPLVVRQLFAGGRRQTLARFPNRSRQDPHGGGFLYVKAALGDGSRSGFRYPGGAVRDWPFAATLETVIFSGPNYWNNTVKVAAIDRTRELIELAGKTSYPITAGNRFFFQNVLAELDAPGEWYWDPAEKAVYFWPESEAELQSVAVPVLQSIVEINGGGIPGHPGRNGHVRLEHLTLDGCAGTAVRARGAQDVSISGCTIVNAGGNAIEIDGGSGNVVTGNDIRDIGGSGIVISAEASRSSFPENNRADNNYIHDVGVLVANSSGIYCGGTGNTVSHNLIHSTPRVGIWFDGNDHLIEYNHVHHVNQQTQDSGVIYSCARDWTKRGTVVRFNYVHDSGGYGRNNAQEPWQHPFKTWGIYLDDFTSGTRLFGNVIAYTKQGAVLVHGGRDNVIENNVIVEGGGIGQLVYSSIPSDSGHLVQMYARLKEGDFGKYPQLKEITGAQQGARMSGNRFERNIVCYTGQAPLYAIYGELDYATTRIDHNLIFHRGSPLRVLLREPLVEWWKWQERGMDRKSVLVDPLLRDPASGDFALSAGSPAPTIGFQPIPLSMIGPYRDPKRASWPVGSRM